MKREIKFRGIHIKTKEWVYSMTISKGTIKRKKDNVYFEVGENKWAQVDPETVGQFTGLYDINSKKIYEGDILTAERYPYQDQGKRNYDYHVEFIHGCWQGVMHCVNPNKNGISHGLNDILCGDGKSKLEYIIIGNIHENNKSE